MRTGVDLENGCEDRRLIKLKNKNEPRKRSRRTKRVQPQYDMCTKYSPKSFREEVGLYGLQYYNLTYRRGHERWTSKYTHNKSEVTASRNGSRNYLDSSTQPNTKQEVLLSVEP